MDKLSRMVADALRVEAHPPKDKGKGKGPTAEKKTAKKEKQSNLEQPLLCLRSPKEIERLHESDFSKSDSPPRTAIPVLLTPASFVWKLDALESGEKYLGLALLNIGLFSLNEWPNEEPSETYYTFCILMANGHEGVSVSHKKSRVTLHYNGKSWQVHEGKIGSKRWERYVTELAGETTGYFGVRPGSMINLVKLNQPGYNMTSDPTLVRDSPSFFAHLNAYGIHLDEKNTVEVLRFLFLLRAKRDVFGDETEIYMEFPQKVNTTVTVLVLDTKVAETHGSRHIEMNSYYDTDSTNSTVSSLANYPVGWGFKSKSNVVSDFEKKWKHILQPNKQPSLQELKSITSDLMNVLTREGKERNTAGSQRFDYKNSSDGVFMSLVFTLHESKLGNTEYREWLDSLVEDGVVLGLPAKVGGNVFLNLSPEWIDSKRKPRMEALEEKIRNENVLWYCEDGTIMAGPAFGSKAVGALPVQTKTKSSLFSRHGKILESDPRTYGSEGNYGDPADFASFLKDFAKVVMNRKKLTTVYMDNGGVYQVFETSIPENRKIGASSVPNYDKQLLQAAKWLCVRLSSSTQIQNTARATFVLDFIEHLKDKNIHFELVHETIQKRYEVRIRVPRGRTYKTWDGVTKLTDYDKYVEIFLSQPIPSHRDSYFLSDSDYEVEGVFGKMKKAVMKHSTRLIYEKNPKKQVYLSQKVERWDDILTSHGDHWLSSYKYPSYEDAVIFTAFMGDLITMVMNEKGYLLEASNVYSTEGDKFHVRYTTEYGGRRMEHFSFDLSDREDSKHKVGAWWNRWMHKIDFKFGVKFDFYHRSLIPEIARDNRGKFHVSFILSPSVIEETDIGIRAIKGYEAYASEWCFEHLEEGDPRRRSNTPIDLYKRTVERYVEDVVYLPGKNHVVSAHYTPTGSADYEVGGFGDMARRAMRTKTGQLLYKKSDEKLRYLHSKVTRWTGIFSDNPDWWQTENPPYEALVIFTAFILDLAEWLVNHKGETFLHGDNIRYKLLVPKQQTLAAVLAHFTRKDAARNHYYADGNSSPEAWWNQWLEYLKEKQVINLSIRETADSVNYEVQIEIQDNHLLEKQESIGTIRRLSDYIPHAIEYCWELADPDDKVYWRNDSKFAYNYTIKYAFEDVAFRRRNQVVSAHHTPTGSADYEVEGLYGMVKRALRSNEKQLLYAKNNNKMRELETHVLSWAPHLKALEGRWRSEGTPAYTEIVVFTAFMNDLIHFVINGAGKSGSGTNTVEYQGLFRRVKPTSAERYWEGLDNYSRHELSTFEELEYFSNNQSLMIPGLGDKTGMWWNGWLKQLEGMGVKVSMHHMSNGWQLDPGREHVFIVDVEIEKSRIVENNDHIRTVRGYKDKAVEFCWEYSREEERFAGPSNHQFNSSFKPDIVNHYNTVLSKYVGYVKSTEKESKREWKQVK